MVSYKRPKKIRIKVKEKFVRDWMFYGFPEGSMGILIFVGAVAAIVAIWAILWSRR